MFSQPILLTLSAITVVGLVQPLLYFPPSRFTLIISPPFSSSFTSFTLTLLFTLLITFLFPYNGVGPHFTSSLSLPPLGLDGINHPFILLTTVIFPLTYLADFNPTGLNSRLLSLLAHLLHTLLITFFLLWDFFCFYLFFEAILIPLIILIGVFGNSALSGYYLFLYTLFGSLIFLISLVVLISFLGETSYDTLILTNLPPTLTPYIFFGTLTSFYIKTPIFYLHSWLLRAHVDSPLFGSVILAALVLKLAVYGIYRIILPVFTPTHLIFTSFTALVATVTLIYGSLTTLILTDFKEIVAYSSINHAAIYLYASFANNLSGLEGSLLLAIGHGFTSALLFISVTLLYNRTGTRQIFYYRGVAFYLPLFAFSFTLALFANCGVPFTLNFVGEFYSLLGIFSRLFPFALLATLSIVFSAAYSISLLNRLIFGPPSLPCYTPQPFFDLTHREMAILFPLHILTFIFGIFPIFITDLSAFSTSTLIFTL